VASVVPTARILTDQGCERGTRLAGSVQLGVGGAAARWGGLRQIMDSRGAVRSEKNAGAGEIWLSPAKKVMKGAQSVDWRDEGEQSILAGLPAGA